MASIPSIPVPAEQQSGLDDRVWNRIRQRHSDEDLGDFLVGWWFATNDVSPPAMYLFETDFLLTLLTGQFDDFVAVSHAGHGVNSYALSYFLVDGPLALFLQTAWGGVYTDPEKAASAWQLLVSHVERLIQAAQSATGVNACGRGERLLVVNSDFRGGGTWAVCQGPLGEDAAHALLETRPYEETADVPHPHQQALIAATAWAESTWLSRHDR